MRAVRSGQPEVYVPRCLGVIQALLAPLPARGRARAAALLGGNRVFERM